MSSPANKELVKSAKKSFLKQLLKNQKSGNHTDFTIACGALEWKVHRLVVCSHSDYFKCLEGFEEGKAGRIDLKEQNPKVIAKVVDYLYEFDYNDCIYDIPGYNGEGSREPSEPQSIKPKKLLFNALMYVASDMYCIERLKLLAKAKFTDALAGVWDKEDLFNVIHFIYDNTQSDDRGLRDSLTPVLVKHKDDLQSDERIMNVVKNQGDFAVDLIKAWTYPNPQASPTSFRLCTRCKKLYPFDYSGQCCGYSHTMTTVELVK